MTTFSHPSDPRPRDVRRARQRQRALARLAQRQAAVRRAVARFGWRLGVLGAALATMLALAAPALGEARAIETLASALAAPPSPREPATYVVQPGDTLFAIARANGLSVDHIA